MHTGLALIGDPEEWLLIELSTDNPGHRFRPRWKPNEGLSPIPSTRSQMKETEGGLVLRDPAVN